MIKSIDNYCNYLLRYNLNVLTSKFTKSVYTFSNNVRINIKASTNNEIENRITYEVVVDSYDGNYALCWRVYLENKLKFPFTAIDKTTTKQVLLQISGLLNEEECMDGMYAYCTVDNDKVKTDELPIALADLEIVEGTALTKQAVGDWHYWYARNYELDDSEFEDDYY